MIVQWGQIKTLFIICFLVLNIFLVRQLLGRQEEDLSFIPETSREEELEFNINGLNILSNESYTAPLLNANSFNYNEEGAGQLEDLPNQQSIVVDDHYLFSRFDEPVSINIEEENEYREIFSQFVFNGGSYSYWGEMESANVLVFFQHFEYPVFFNENALLLVQLNGDGDMTQYVQTRLVKGEEDDEEQSLIQQYDAVYRLYHHTNALQTGDEITDVNLGYHNIVSLPNGEQLLNPTWDIEVNGDDHQFINAIEGHDYSRNNDFYADVLVEFIDLLDQAEEDRLAYYNLDLDDEEEEQPEALLNTIKQSLIGIYHNIAEVESE